MSEIKPYYQCATRLENRGANPPTKQYVANLVEGLKLSGVEATWHSAVDHKGKPLFPSKVFPHCHPQSSLEAFKHLLDSVHAIGRPVMSWYPLNLGGGVLESHPDWQMKFYDIEGTPPNPKEDQYYVCINSPYGRMLPQFVAEVVADVGFDGIWFDGSTFSNHNTWPWFLPGCKCDWCRDQFKKDAGLALPEKIDYENRTFKEWVRWRYDILMAEWKACVDAVLAVRSDAIVCFNNYRRRHPGMFVWNTAIPMRKLDWNCMLSSELDSFPHQADFQMKMYRAYECAYGAESWWPLCDHGNVWVPDHDPLTAIQAHLGAISAGGAACMGVGVAVKIVAPVLKKIQDQAGPRIQYKDGREVEYAALWCSERHQDFACKDNPHLAWSEWHGANELCRHSHLQNSVIFDDHINENDLKRFPVLLVGETRCVSVGQAAVLKKYVESGGILLACREAGTLDEWGDTHSRPVLDDLLGIRTRRPGKGFPTLETVSAFDKWITCKGAFVVAEPMDDVKLLAKVVERTTSSWDGVETDNTPAPRSDGLWVRTVGKGAVIWAGVELFGNYLETPSPQMRRLFHQLLTSLRTPKVTLEGPICVTANTRIRPDGTWMIHLHNCPGTAYAYPNPSNGVFTHAPGEVIPIHDLVIRLNGLAAKEAKSGLTHQSFTVSDNGNSIKIPRLDLHDVIILSW
jgi:hypothetical protein